VKVPSRGKMSPGTEALFVALCEKEELPSEQTGHDLGREEETLSLQSATSPPPVPARDDAWTWG